jgi:predicted permease
MGYMDVLNQIIVLFAVMLIGYYAGHKGIITPGLRKGLSELLLRVTLPLMIVASFNFNFSMDMLLNGGRIFIYSFLIQIMLILLSRLLYYKYPHEKKAVLRFITSFSNCGFMGYPIIKSIFNSEGVFYTSIYNIAFNVLIWTAGVMFFTDSKDRGSIKKILLNPCILAVFIGILIFVLRIPVPKTVWSILDLTGDITTPLSMMVIGAMLSEMRLKDIISGFELYYVSFIRLIAAPLLVYMAFKLLHLNSMVSEICFIITAMPGAVNTAIISDKYGGDSALASKCVFATTVFSAITIPIMLLLI